MQTQFYWVCSRKIIQKLSVIQFSILNILDLLIPKESHPTIQPLVHNNIICFWHDKEYVMVLVLAFVVVEHHETAREAEMLHAAFLKEFLFCISKGYIRTKVVSVTTRIAVKVFDSIRNTCIRDRRRRSWISSGTISRTGSNMCNVRDNGSGILQ